MDGMDGMDGMDPLQFILMNLRGNNFGSNNNNNNSNNSNSNFGNVTQGAEDMKSELCREHKTKDGKKIQVRKGDLTCEDVDVIVNAANDRLVHQRGLAGAIVKKRR